jgi:hypothetical protein
VTEHVQRYRSGAVADAAKDGKTIALRLFPLGISHPPAVPETPHSSHAIGADFDYPAMMADCKPAAQMWVLKG